jgi:ribosomal protein S18 acetylase RimI-like enzyme
MKLRRVNPNDLEQISSIESRCYSKNLIESKQRFKRLIDVYPKGCYGVEVEDKLIAYIFFLPWKRGSVLKLNDPTLELPDNPDCMYIHDLAVDPKFRGRGIARRLAGHALNIFSRREYQVINLVAVQKSETFWAKFGFRPVTEISYGGERAIFMELLL